MDVKPPSLEEYRAIHRLKQGDLDGLELLVERYQVRAVYAAYLIVRDLMLAEDIVQSAFLRAVQKIDQFDERRPFGPWFLRSVINAAIKAAKQQVRFVSLDGEHPQETCPLVDWLIDPNPRPDQVIETEETRQMVWDALAQLPANQRAAVVMRHFLDMDETEMTRELRRSLTTVRWWLRTARNRLRDLLRPFWLRDYPDEDRTQV